MIYFLRHTMTISTNYIRRLSLSTGVPSGTCWRLENRVFQSILEEIHGRPYEMRVQKLLVPTTPMYVTWGLSIWHESNPLKKWNTWWNSELPFYSLEPSILIFHLPEWTRLEIRTAVWDLALWDCTSGSLSTERNTDPMKS